MGSVGLNSVSPRGESQLSAWNQCQQAVSNTMWDGANDDGVESDEEKDNDRRLEFPINTGVNWFIFNPVC